MATATYTEVLKLAEQLPPEEQRRLRDELDRHTRRPTEAEVAALLAQVDAVAAEVGAAWQGDMGAVEAVAEQRREL